MAILSTLLQVSILVIVAYILYTNKKIEKTQFLHTDYLNSILGYRLKEKESRKKSDVPDTQSSTMELEDHSGSEFSPFPVYQEKTK